MEALNVEQAAKRLGMSESWLYKAVTAGTIPHIRFGRSIRFDPAQLDAFKAARVREVLR